MPFGAISCDGMLGPCFHEKTLVLTNRGYVPISEIDIIHDTINNQTIIALVKDIKPKNNMVLIEPHSFKENVPSNRVLLDSNCKVKIDKDIYFIINRINGSRIRQVKYNGYGYNVILKGNKGMFINNMLTETLNINAKISLYTISKLLDIAKEKAEIKIKKDNITSKLVN